MSNKQDQLNNINICFIFIFIIIIFFSAAFFLLLKDPPISHDEAFFSSIAYGINNPDQISLQPFLKRISSFDIQDYLQHGPIFYFFLRIPLKIIPFNISNIRTISVFIGACSLITIFFIASDLLKSKSYGLAVTAMMAVEYNFLRSSRNCRPDILVFLFSCLAIYFYTKIFSKTLKKKYLLYSSIFLTLGFLTHYYLGFIALLTISFYYFLSKKKIFNINENDLFLFIIPFLSLILYLFLIYLLNPHFIEKFTDFSSTRINPDFHSIQVILNGDWYIKILFIIYLVIPLFLVFKIKNKYANFLFLYYVFSVLFVTYGGNPWYLLFIPLPAILSLFLLIKSAKKSIIKYFLLLLAFCIFAINLIEQYRLNLHYSGYSYNNFGRLLSEKISKNSKVLLSEMDSEPFFYFVANRKDLKLSYITFADNKNINFEDSLSEADYLITSVNDINLAQKYKEINDKRGVYIYYIEFIAKNAKEIYQPKEYNNFVLIKF